MGFVRRGWDGVSGGDGVFASCGARQGAPLLRLLQDFVFPASRMVGRVFSLNHVLRLYPPPSPPPLPLPLSPPAQPLSIPLSTLSPSLISLPLSTLQLLQYAMTAVRGAVSADMSTVFKTERSPPTSDSTHSASLIAPPLTPHSDQAPSQIRARLLTPPARRRQEAKS